MAGSIDWMLTLLLVCVPLILGARLLVCDYRERELYWARLPRRWNIKRQRFDTAVQAAGFMLMILALTLAALSLPGS